MSRKIAMAVSLSVLAFARMRAQTPVERDCVAANLESSQGADSVRWIDRRPADMRRRLKSTAWSAIADSLQAVFLPDNVTGLTSADRATLLLQLDSLRAELKSADADSLALRDGRITQSRFQLFAGDQQPTYTLFVGRTSPKVAVTDNSSPDARVAVCGLALAARDVSVIFSRAALASLSQGLRGRANRWDRFMNKGYSMLPHEVLLNSLVPRATLEPPRIQGILAHPSVAAMVVSGDMTSLRDARREDVLAVEVAGILGYNDQFTWHAGASWILTFPSEGKLGAGVMAHLGKLGRAAFIWRPADPDGVHRNGFLLSVDLYQHLTSASDRWKRLQVQSVGVDALARCVLASDKHDCPPPR